MIPRTASARSALSDGDALDRIATGAVEADAGMRGLAADMTLLTACGMLERLCSEADPASHVTLLRRIGRASQSVGRLAEGHMNALGLVTLYGTVRQQHDHRAAARSGTIFGVWGADGEPPVRILRDEGAGLYLTGCKRFASGLGTVSRAVVTAQTSDGPRLVIADVTDPARADAEAWNTSGMRATASGRYDFEGVQAEPLGVAGDYLREPHFEGGVWRYAAVHVGGLEALAEEVRQAVRAQGDEAGEAQLHRVARLASLAHGSRLFVEDAARQVAAPDAGKDAVAVSLAAREAVEAACQEAIALADRALGTRAFGTGHRVDLVRRDLGLFLRQANLDGKLRSVGQTVCRSVLPVGETWG
ncbi:MAG: acyl-CoA dehydrogenase [Rhodobacteraceae bacterium]|uniref:acyl-CoA dehydrogenase n=1 Tax=Salipiger thiooxidans TaxID=282683 RepID=UPI001A8EFA48|nr:acyl-CoA dehydrogenase [Salipiger thiooxidans]MBN8189762.1 acyl-CoA dehydrogenase [Salipiger thiooxidans]MBR9840528.1 acyl-CoA dehydrogenase [Paracoccaceae bacterium]